VLTESPGSSATPVVAPSVAAAGVAAARRTSTAGALRAVRRRATPVLAMTPFVVFTLLGLGIPTFAVINNAFRTQSGQLTTANVSLISRGIYRTGFENSFILALISSIVPGILGVVLAYAIAVGNSGWLKRVVTTASGVFANFGGINLTFMFIATIGTTGLVTHWLANVGLNPWDHGFNLYSFYGVALVYMYFQIPLMVLVITPAFVGLRPSWREAAQGLGAGSIRYWRHVGIPVLLPSILGGMLLLFGSAFAAYATADSLTAGTVTLAPIQIGAVLNGNVIAGEENVGYAIGLGMLIVLAGTMLLYALVRRWASKWLR
jgi:putative spermidine/putrescine transport system permease protein